MSPYKFRLYLHLLYTVTIYNRASRFDFRLPFVLKTYSLRVSVSRYLIFNLPRIQDSI
nr:MAG TPA: hypothetical protein [Caudoviricetes sp.]